MGLGSLYQKLKTKAKEAVTGVLDKYRTNNEVLAKPKSLENFIDDIASKTETFTKPVDRNTAYLLETDSYSRECAKKEGLYKVVDGTDLLNQLYEKLSSSIKLEDLTQQKILSLITAKKGCRVFADNNLESILNNQGFSADGKIGFDFETAAKAIMKSALKNYVEKLKQTDLKEDDLVRAWARVGKYMDKMSPVLYGDDMNSIRETVALEATKNYVMNKSAHSLDSVAIQLLIGSVRNRSHEFNHKLNYVMDSAKHSAGMYAQSLKNSIEVKVKTVKDIAFEGIRDIDRRLHENLSAAKSFYDRQRQYAKDIISQYHDWLNYSPQTA